LGVLVFVVLGVAMAGADEEKVDLGKLCLEKRGAVIHLIGPMGKLGSVNSLGVFISKDGYALVDLQALVAEEAPICQAMDGKKLKLEKVLGVFPSAESALVKFAAAPKQWLELAEEEPDDGESVALMTVNIRDLEDVEVPPLVGRVLLKRSAFTPNLKELQFARVMSLGAGVTRAQQGLIGPGSYAMDADGGLVGLMLGMDGRATQIRIYLASVAGFRAEIERLKKEGEGLNVPLRGADDPTDPAGRDPEFHNFGVAWRQREWVKCRKLMELIKKRHPESPWVERKQAQLTAMLMGDLDYLLELPPPDPESSAANQMFEWAWRSSALVEKFAVEEAVEARKKAVALSPEDYPEHRMQMANYYKNVMDYDEAEKLMKQCYPYCSDTIDNVESYESLLVQMGKWDEAEKMTERVEELVRLYRRW
jgi:tetratricopeptide (TPR) repeat protein